MAGEGKNGTCIASIGFFALGNAKKVATSCLTAENISSTKNVKHALGTATYGIVHVAMRATVAHTPLRDGHSIPAGNALARKGVMAFAAISGVGVSGRAEAI